MEVRVSFSAGRSLQDLARSVAGMHQRDDSRSDKCRRSADGLCLCDHIRNLLHVDAAGFDLIRRVRHTSLNARHAAANEASDFGDDGHATACGTI